VTDAPRDPEFDPDDDLREDDEIPDNDAAVPFDQGEEDRHHRFAVFRIPVPDYHE
jgi:hypothetical protein